MEKRRPTTKNRPKDGQDGSADHRVELIWVPSHLWGLGGKLQNNQKAIYLTTPLGQRLSEFTMYARYTTVPCHWGYPSLEPLIFKVLGPIETLQKQ